MISVYIHCMSWNMIGISSGLFFARSSGQKLGGHHADIDVPWINQGCEYDHDKWYPLVT